MPLSWIYKRTMTFGKPVIMGFLNQRLKNGKEDPERLQERFGMPSRSRPENSPLMWVHVASVGEAQSMLHLIDLFLEQHQTGSVLVTSITRTSAALLEKRLPARAFHQYLPVDRPKWVKRFLDYWQPTLILWAESELWPSILSEIELRHIPMALINARMSQKSFKNWSRVKGLAQDILATFTVILTQTDIDKNYYTELGARSVITTGNIKFAAIPLPCDADDLKSLQIAIGNRPLWVYASTHAGEEELAAKVHSDICTFIPELLTIIIPRHPERRADILKSLEPFGLNITPRSQHKILPNTKTDIYVVDTLGELGLFYRLSPLSVIGRSFSTDGGGGHNPLEAAQLKSAILHGPHVQNLSDIYTPMMEAGATLCLKSPEDLAPAIRAFLTDKESLNKLSEKGYNYSQSQTQILSNVIEELEPVFLLAELPVLKTRT
jgi:3-deoxy-D-manno-octulosonic-acid transferase